jgi:signal transduction histidine kinase/CheY-like chemotaxis protein
MLSVRLRFGLSQTVRTLGWVVYSFVLWSSLAASPAAPGPLKSIAEVLALTNDEADKHFPVDLKAVITLCSPERYLCFLQDGKDGIYAHVASVLGREGDLIELKGTTKRGRYAPIITPEIVTPDVRHEIVRVLGHPGLPAPFEAGESDLIEDRFANARVEVRGTVTGVRLSGSSLIGPASLLLRVGKEEVVCYWPLGVLNAIPRLSGARVKVNAILGAEVTSQGHRKGPVLFAKSPADIAVITPGEEDWPDLPLTPLSSLLRYHGVGRLGERIRVRGISTIVTAERLQIQDGETAIAIDPAATSSIPLGDLIEAVGTLALSEGSGLWLDGAIARDLGKAAPVTPLAVDEGQVFAPTAAGLLIQIDGIVGQQSFGSKSDVLFLTAPANPSASFVAELFHSLDRGSLRQFVPGDRIRVTGVYDVDEVRSGLRGTTRRVILRRPDEARLIFREPLWKRIPWIEVTAVSFFVMAAVLGWAWSLRRQVQRKTASLARQSQELSMARDRAEEGARAKADFLSTMSHEIRTPLNGVIGMTSVLLETPLSASQRECLETIHHSGEALLGVINDILDFSKIESGKLTFETVEFEVLALSKQCLDLVGDMARRKALVLSSQVDPDVPAVLTGDPTRLRQILLNLLSNAVKFTADGSVKLIIRKASGHGHQIRVRMEVVDTGIGISDEARSKLFETFVQGDSSTTRRYGGTGLGLAISKRIVELMGGSIGCSSQVGQGSTFWIEVPLARSTAASESAALQPQPASELREAVHPSLSVLIAEDNVVNQRVGTLMLERLGCRVDVASDGAKAFDAWSRGNYDLILMDCQMPDVDGFLATAQIREAETVKGKRTPIVALTANVMAGERERCLAAGMDDYLPKPLMLSSLAGVIAQLAPKQAS